VVLKEAFLSLEKAAKRTDLLVNEKNQNTWVGILILATPR
jgi:hypothetical protein